MLRTISFAGAALVILLASGIVAFLLAGPEGRRGEGGINAAAQQAAPGQVDAAAGAEPPAEPGSNNAIARQASKWGIRSCAREIALVSDFLTRNSDYSARSIRGSGEADGQVFSATIVSRERANGIESVSTMTVAPVGGERCNVVYETTAHFPGGCEQARQAHFTGFAEEIEFGAMARVYGTATGDGHVYMMPASDGCLVKKTQVIY